MRGEMERNPIHILDNQNGFILGASILVSAILIMAGVLALWTSTTEVQVVRNEGLMIQEFYNAEGGVIDALVNYNTGSTDWLTDDFLIADPTAAKNIVVSNGPDGQSLATIEARCIENSGATIAGLSEAANRLPRQNHISPPPAGSGYSLKYFEVRRYGITATSTDGKTRVQVGAWKVFNKY
jgi:hypothetical protein